MAFSIRFSYGTKPLPDPVWKLQWRLTQKGWFSFKNMIWKCQQQNFGNYVQVLIRLICCFVVNFCYFQYIYIGNNKDYHQTFQILLMYIYKNNISIWYLKSELIGLWYTVMKVHVPWNSQLVNVHLYIYSMSMSMVKCKTAVTPVHYQWSYCSLALSHRCDYSCVIDCWIDIPYDKLKLLILSVPHPILCWFN